MPTYQTIIVDITPGAKEKPVLNASQFDNGRPFMVALAWGGVPFTDAGDFDIEIHVKKPDGNIVTAEPDSVVNEVCSFLTTEQMCACHGINECEIVLLDNDKHIGTGNFILDVEKAPDEGGIQSASEIANLETQIARIVPEVIGDDYYNKTQTDALLANKADVSDLPDMTNYYDKSQTDTLLAAKADISDLPDMTDYYTKTQTYSQAEVNALIDNIFPTFTASGNVATFTTALNKPLVSVTADPLATKITRLGINQWDEEWELGVFDNTTGEKVANNSNSRSKNKTRVLSDTQYYLVMPDAVRVFFYRADESFISTQVVPITNQLITTPNDCAYINFQFSGTTYNNNRGINYPATDTSYHAYNGQTVPVADAITITTLTGVNNVFADAGSVTVQYKYMSM